MSDKEPEDFTEKLKDLFGDLKEPPKNTIEQDYPGLFPNWK